MEGAYVGTDRRNSGLLLASIPAVPGPGGGAQPVGPAAQLSAAGWRCRYGSARLGPQSRRRAPPAAGTAANLAPSQRGTLPATIATTSAVTPTLPH